MLRRSRNCTLFAGMFVALCGARLVVAQGTAAQGTNEAGANPAMLQNDRSFVQAVTKADTSALAKLLDAEFTWTDFEGRQRTRAQVLQAVPKLAIADETGVDQTRTERKSFAYGSLGDVQINQGRAHVVRVWAKRADGWKLVVYQELMTLEAAPTFAPGAGKDCENPCKGIPFQPKTETERQVSTAYSKLETAAMAKNSAVFSTMVADEFVAASSNSNKLAGKRERMDDFDHSKNAGVAPTPLKTVRMFDFGDAVLMTSDHVPDRGRPLRVTRIWVKRNGGWVETISYQTSVK